MGGLLQKAKNTAVTTLFLASAGYIFTNAMRSELPPPVSRDVSTISYPKTESLEKQVKSQDIDKARVWISKYVPLNEVDKTESLASDYVAQLKRQTGQISLVLDRLSDKYPWVPRHIMEALVYSESSLDPHKKGSTGDHNLTQITHIAYKDLKETGFRRSWREIQDDPIAALEAGYLIMGKNLKLAENNKLNAYVMYNGGRSQVLRAMKKAGSSDISKYKKHLKYGGRKLAVPYAQRTDKLAESIRRLGFFDAVLAKEIGNIVFTYNEAAEKELSAGNYKTAAAIWADLYKTEGLLYLDNPKEWKAKIQYNLGEAHRHMGNLGSAKKMYRLAKAHAGTKKDNIYIKNASYRLSTN